MVRCFDWLHVFTPQPAIQTLLLRRPRHRYHHQILLLSSCSAPKSASHFAKNTGRLARKTFKRGAPAHLSESTNSLKLYPKFPSPPPKELLAHRDLFNSALRERRYAVPEGEKVDTPLYSLYRLYEYIVLDNNIGMRNEIEAFWWKGWPVKEIPDPKDDGEPERYAILACIPALLVESFNQRINLGFRRGGHSIMTLEERQALAAMPKVFESPPRWVSRVPPLAETLHIPHTIAGKTQLKSLDDERASPPFKEKNILIWHPHTHFI